MILLLDNIINNYLNILSCLIIISIFNLNKINFFTMLLIDIILNKIPFVSIIVLLLFYLNKIVFKYVVNSNINKFIFTLVYYFIFMNILFLINNKCDYIYFLKNNIFAFITNIVFYIIYIFYK